MSVKVKGMNKVLNELQSKLSRIQAGQVADAALVAGSSVTVKELKSQLETFKVTGATIEELQVSAPMTVNGVRSVKIYWRGPEQRYRIIHLNEWGTIKNPRPRGKGKIAVGLRNSEKPYRSIVKKVIKAAL